jgi:hypothetical protein
MADKFIFRSNQTIGAAAAEDDGAYLSECFVDNGTLSIIRDCDDPRCILIGRTGAGKSALLSCLREQEEHVIQIDPFSISLSYLSNSTVIQFFLEIGVKLDLFYWLLWRHIFCVELLQERFGVDSEDKFKRFLVDIWNYITRNRKHEMAIDYLRKWGQSFWQETDYRIKEVTSTLERNLEGAVKETIPGLKLDFSAARQLTQEQKAEVLHRGQSVVNEVQVRELSSIIDFLDEVLLTDRQKRYYIVIDKLDEKWVEDQLRFQLIRALIETAREFTRIKNIKIVVAIRRDLLDRVFRHTRDSGFQEEKYRTSSLDLYWDKKGLSEVLDTRINYLVRRKYSGGKVSYKDFIRTVNLGKNQRIDPMDYILERSLMRPRDIIHFFNECIAHANGKSMIDNRTLFEAEGVYSRERFRALLDEWYGIYPYLVLNSELLWKRRPNFRVADLSNESITEVCLKAVDVQRPIYAEDINDMLLVAEDKLSPEEYRRKIMLIFYKVGLVGLRTSGSKGVSWIHQGASSVSGPEIDEETRVYIHTSFHRHFGINEGSTKKSD